MHTRYVTPDLATIEQIFHPEVITGQLLRELELPDFYTTPTQLIPIIRPLASRSRGSQELLAIRWGLIPFYAQGVPGPFPELTARMETIRNSTAYGPAWRRGQRCLIPAAGFYEWQAQPPDWQSTIAYYVTVADQPRAFAMAGLWDESTTADGETICSCNIVTMQANSLMREIHNSKEESAGREPIPEALRRMPAILHPEEHERWLRGNEQEAWSVLRPYPAARMRATPIHAPQKGSAPHALEAPLSAVRS